MESPQVGVTVCLLLAPANSLQQPHTGLLLSCIILVCGRSNRIPWLPNSLFCGRCRQHNAALRRAVQDVLSSAQVAPVTTKLECAKLADGAAALVLVPAGSSARNNSRGRPPGPPALPCMHREVSPAHISKQVLCYPAHPSCCALRCAPFMQRLLCWEAVRARGPSARLRTCQRRASQQERQQQLPIGLLGCSQLTLITGACTTASPSASSGEAEERVAEVHK